MSVATNSAMAGSTAPISRAMNSRNACLVRWTVSLPSVNAALPPSSTSPSKWSSWVSCLRRRRSTRTDSNSTHPMTTAAATVARDASGRRSEP